MENVLGPFASLSEKSGSGYSTPTTGARIEAGLHNKVAAFRQGQPPPPSDYE